MKKADLPNDDWCYARKPQACECCNRVIRVGQAYYRPTGRELFCTTVCYELWCTEQSATERRATEHPPQRPFPPQE